MFQSHLPVQQRRGHGKGGGKLGVHRLFRVPASIAHAALLVAHQVGSHLNGFHILRPQPLPAQAQRAVDGAVGTSAAGVRLVVHLHDVPLLSQAIGHHLRLRLIGHVVKQPAVLSRQNELRPGHPGLCQERGFAAACRCPGRVKHLVGGSVRQERPGPEGLGSRQAQGTDSLILVKAQELGAGRRRSEGSGRGRHMPSQIPVG